MKTTVTVLLMLTGLGAAILGLMWIVDYQNTHNRPFMVSVREDAPPPAGSFAEKLQLEAIINMREANFRLGEAAVTDELVTGYEQGIRDRRNMGMHQWRDRHSESLSDDLKLTARSAFYQGLAAKLSERLGYGVKLGNWNACDESGCDVVIDW